MTVQVGTRSQIRVVARERRLGTIVRNAGVAVTNVSTGGAATVYSDEDLTTVITSLVTDGSGVFSFYAPPGTYSISFTGSDAFEAVENVHVVGDDTSPTGTYALPVATLSLLNYGTRALAGTAMIAAIAAADPTAHTIIEVPDGAYTWDAVPGLPRSITGSLTIRLHHSVITLTAGGPRLFDFARTADYQTFQNITLDGSGTTTIDCNNVAGKHHVIVGNYVNTSFTTGQRANFAHIRVRGFRTINVPVDSTTVAHRLNVWIQSYHPGLAEATQTSLIDIVVEDVRMSGGNQGVFIGGGCGQAGSAVNVYLDDIHIKDCWHSLLVAPSANYSSANFQIGSRGLGGRCSIRRCYGYGSGDVGVEVDGLTSIVVEDTTIEDSYNACFYHANIQPAPDVNEQRVTFCRSHGRQLTSMTGATPVSFKFNVQNSNPLTHIDILDCSHYRNTADATIQGEAIFASGIQLDRLRVRDFKFTIEGMTYTSGAVTPKAIMLSALTGSPSIKLRNIDGYVSGTGSGDGNMTWDTIDISGVTLRELVIDGVSVDYALSSMGAGTVRGIGIGRLTTTLASCTVRGYKVKSVGGTSRDSTPRGIVFYGTATLTVSQELLVDDCDFTNLPSGTRTANTEMFCLSGQNSGKVRASNIKWANSVYPRPATAMAASNFASAAFTTATGNQYIGLVPASLLMTGGAGVTTIEISKDYGATYQTVWTQASGALTQNLLLGVDNGDFVRVTFATTQPTTTVMFSR